MIQMPKKLNLTERTLRVHVIVESVRYLLNSHQLISLSVQQRASKNHNKHKTKPNQTQSSQIKFQNLKNKIDVKTHTISLKQFNSDSSTTTKKDSETHNFSQSSTETLSRFQNKIEKRKNDSYP